MFGMQAYGGPMSASLVVLHHRNELMRGDNIVLLNQGNYNRVCKHGPVTERNRWQYLFETARVAWGSMKFDAGSLQDLQRMRMEAVTYAESDEGAEGYASSSEDETAQNTENWEVQSVATDNPTNILAGMSERKRGKMKLIQVEEAESDREQLEPPKKKVKFAPSEEDKSLVMKITEVTQLLEELEEKLNETDDPVEKESLFELQSQLDTEREDLREEYQDHLKKVARAKPVKRPVCDVLSDDEVVAVGYLMSITKGTWEESVQQLEKSNWDVDFAVSHWLEKESYITNPEDSEMAEAIRISTDEFNKSIRISTDESNKSTFDPKSAASPSAASESSSKRSTINERPTSYAEAGPSNKRQALDTAEELADMRARLLDIIALAQRSNHTTNPQSSITQTEDDSLPVPSSSSGVQQAMPPPRDIDMLSPPTSPIEEPPQVNEDSLGNFSNIELQIRARMAFSEILQSSPPTIPLGEAPLLIQESNAVGYIREGTPAFFENQRASPVDQTSSSADAVIEEPLSFPKSPVPESSTSFISELSILWKSNHSMDIGEMIAKLAEERRDSAVGSILRRIGSQDNKDSKVEQDEAVDQKSEQEKNVPNQE